MWFKWTQGFRERQRGREQGQDDDQLKITLYNNL